MTQVVCIKVGHKYKAEYVNKLESMIRNHTTREHTFVCLTDDPTGVNVPWVPIGGSAPTGWWSKLVLFKPHIALVGARTLFFDLDTVIVGSIDRLFDYRGPFCIIKDWWAPGYNSSVMSIDTGYGHHVWERFLQSPEDVMENYHGDQDWITEQLPGEAIWQEVAPGLIGSYKANELYKGPSDYSVVCFHGNPKPHEFTEGWVKDAWIQNGKRLSMARN